MPTSFTSTYILPAIVLNPLVVLHGFNTFASHWIPSAISTVASQSPHKIIEALGPIPGHADPYLDLHANDHLCWGYTMAMVLLQVIAYGKVSGNREIRKERKERKLERERERSARLYEAGHASTTSVDSKRAHAITSNGLKQNGAAFNGHAVERLVRISDGSANPLFTDGSSDTTELTDTSEEEMIV